LLLPSLAKQKSKQKRRKRHQNIHKHRFSPGRCAVSALFPSFCTGVLSNSSTVQTLLGGWKYYARLPERYPVGHYRRRQSSLRAVAQVPLHVLVAEWNAVLQEVNLLSHRNQRLRQ
jgi:hypothetical protein